MTSSSDSQFDHDLDATEEPARRPSFDPLHMLRRKLGGESPSTRRRGWTKALLAVGLCCLTLIGVIAAAPSIWLHFNKLPDIRSLENYAPVQSIKIYDRDDKLVAAISADEDRRPVKLAQISPAMRKAMIGAEDHDFYHHGGINPSSIFRAMIANLKAHRIVEGGSTITQQLVKNLFFPGERRTYNRKIKEFFLANEVDQKYPKDKILEMYLNQIYFGNQSYGIESAAQRYFNKPASKLTMGESTFLAGLVRSPSFLSNPMHRDQAFARQHEVLNEMVSYGMLTSAQAKAAQDEHLKFRKFVNPYQKYPFYLSYVMDELREHYGEQELQHGLNVYTCLDQAAQAAGEQTITYGIEHAPAGVKQGALVSLHVSDAGVLAMVGGAGDFEDHQWNRAVSPHTMGSSFKPFVYLTGFMKGLTPTSIVQDAPFSALSGGQWYTPHNFDYRFFGPMTVKMALTDSRNVCAVRIAAMCGINNVINTAHLAGITSKLDPYLPTAIGACAASPLEMAGAYSTFARGGIYLTPHLVRRIESPDGKVIYRYDEKPKKVFDSFDVSELLECMQNVVQHGTGIYAQLPNRPVAGKTGTADKSKDIWFVGFTPDTCTAVWGGNDHNKAVGNRAVTGGMVMAGIWKKYMLAYYDIHPTQAGSFMLASKAPAAIAAVPATASPAGSASDGKNGAATDGSKRSSDSNDTSDASDSASSGSGNQANSAAATNAAPTNRRSRKLIARRADQSAQPTKPTADKSETPPTTQAADEETSSPEGANHGSTPAASTGAAAAAEEPAQEESPAIAPRPAAPAPRSQVVLMRGADGRLYLVPLRRPYAAAPTQQAAPHVVTPPAQQEEPQASPEPSPSSTDDQ